MEFRGFLEDVGRDIGVGDVGVKGGAEVKYFKKVEEIKK